MKIRFERGGVVLEYERRPMPEGHFRALCALAAAVVYAGMVGAITALCGLLGLGVAGVITFLVVALWKALD